jgi:hypothetical protein
VVNIEIKASCNGIAGDDLKTGGRSRDHDQGAGVSGNDDPASVGGAAHEICECNEQCCSASARDLDVRQADLIADGLFE